MKEHGAIIVDGVQSASTHKCPHCGGHFLLAKGNLDLARRTLGEIARPKAFCSRCARLTCGRPCCDPAVVGCIPVEARLDHVEGKRTTYDNFISEAEQRGIVII